MDDVDRVIEFVATYDASLAAEIDGELENSPADLIPFPRRGSRLSEFEPREVREFRVRRYLMRYEVTRTDLIVLRIFHAREDR
jgi:plasmid stabilization system protein ParE